MDGETEFERDVVANIAEMRRRAMGYTMNVADAEDLVQETMVKAYTVFDTLCDDTYSRPWLPRIMCNTWLSDYRTRQRRASMRRSLGSAA